MHYNPDVSFMHCFEVLEVRGVTFLCRLRQALHFTVPTLPHILFPRRPLGSGLTGCWAIPVMYDAGCDGSAYVLGAVWSAYVGPVWAGWLYAK